MGIRVHKMIGYGLTDVQTEKYHLADPRINAKSPLLEHSGKLTMEGFVEFMKAQDEETSITAGIYSARVASGRPFKKVPDDAVVHRTEYGMPEVLCIRPPWLEDWARFDDIIDWVEETHLRDDPQMNWFRLLPHSIYPYSGMYADMRTGSRLRGAIMDWHRVWSRVQEDGTDLAEHEGLKEMLDILATSLGFKDHEEAVTYVMPMVPEDIAALCRYGELFTDDSVILQLRPMVYVYWG